MIPTREQIGQVKNTGEQILENLMDIRNYFGIRTRMLTVTCETHNEEHIRRIVKALEKNGFEISRVY